MTHAKDIRAIIGIIGTVISSLISLSRMPRFIQMYKKKSVEDYNDPGRHVAMLVKCSLWFLYGLPFIQKDGILVTITNGVGFIIELVYIIVYSKYCNQHMRGNTLCSLGSGLVVVGYIYSEFIRGAKTTKLTWIGVICNVYTILMYFVLAVAAGADRFGYMSLRMSLFSIINAGIWTAYSLIYKIDIFVLISNGLGVFFSICYLLIVNVHIYKSQAAVAPQPSDEQIPQV